MAGGKQTPRQKMINMMYLVLTAMLALNVSKDILKALTKLDDSLTETISTVERKNADIYNAFVAAASENPEKAMKWKNMADEVQLKSQAIYGYISNMKDTLVQLSGGYEEDGHTPSALDAKSAPSNYLLSIDGPKKATELKEKIEAYRDEMLQFAGDNEQVKNNILTVFNTDKVKEGDKQVTWESSNFAEYPLGAILPFLTDIQARIRNTESEVITELQSNIGKSDLKFTGVRTVVVPNAKFITQGDKYEAEVFLAAYDDTQEPTIIINGEPLAADNIQNGVGTVSFPANSVGEKTWQGEIKIKQMGKEEPLVYPIEPITYTVAPQSLVISPTKMNVLYRGVDNPLEIGVPGVDPAKISASGPGVRKIGNGQYVADVTKVRGKEVTISVSVQKEDKDGNVTTKSAGSKKFRIKNVPQAEGTIYKRTGGRFSKSTVASATVEATLADFPFDLPLSVVSFELAIPNSPPEQIRGNKIPGDVQTKIKRLPPNSTVTFRDIKARGPKGLRVDKVSPISVDVSN